MKLLYLGIHYDIMLLQSLRTWTVTRRPTILCLLMLLLFLSFCIVYITYIMLLHFFVVYFTLYDQSVSSFWHHSTPFLHQSTPLWRIWVVIWSLYFCICQCCLCRIALLYYILLYTLRSIIIVSFYSFYPYPTSLLHQSTKYSTLEYNCKFIWVLW